MATHFRHPARSTSWADICYSVEAVPFADLVPGYEVRATDRQRLIVGRPEGQKPVIFAAQSNQYSIIPNSLLQSVSDRLIDDYRIDCRHTPAGEFAIQLIIPGRRIRIGSQTDTLDRCLVFNNSYNGKAPFKVQGSVISSSTVERHQEARVRVSYYRQICSNGLMGWSDEFMNLDDYLSWLTRGQPKKYADAREVKTTFEAAHTYQETTRKDSDLLLSEQLHHKGLDLAKLEGYLESVIRQFLTAETSLTLSVYEKLARKPVASLEQAHGLLVDAGLLKRLARQALERMELEERQLETAPNLWLLYNAANHALFNGQSSLTIAERFRQDETLFHHLAKEALVAN